MKVALDGRHEYGSDLRMGSNEIQFKDGGWKQDDMIGTKSNKKREN